MIKVSVQPNNIVQYLTKTTSIIHSKYPKITKIALAAISFRLLYFVVDTISEGNKERQSLIHSLIDYDA